MKTDKTQNKKTIKEVYELYELERKYKDIKKKYEDKKKKLQTSIKNFMFANDWSNFSFVNGSDNVSVKKIVRKKIKWNVDKLEEKLDGELCNEFIDKQYIITNMEGLIKYLKSCGVSPKKFKSFICVEKKVNQKKMDELSELGEISKEDIKGCFELVEQEGYLKIDIAEIIEEDEEE